MDDHIQLSETLQLHRDFEDFVYQVYTELQDYFVEASVPIGDFNWNIGKFTDLIYNLN